MDMARRWAWTGLRGLLVSDALIDWKRTYGVREEIGGNRCLCSGLADC
jgi:hypothetical protein